MSDERKTYSDLLSDSQSKVKFYQKVAIAGAVGTFLGFLMFALSLAF